MISWSSEIRSIFLGFHKNWIMCFHLCLTSFVWHNIFSVFCFLNFLLIYFYTRSFPEKEMSPVFITFIRNIWIPVIFLCCMWHLYYLFIYFLFGCSRSQSWSMGYSSLTRNWIRAPALGAESSHLTTREFLDIHVFICSLFSFIIWLYHLFQGWAFVKQAVSGIYK